MIISSITPPQVWAASSRSLTNIGSGALASTSGLQATIAASANVDLRPSAGTVGQITVAAQTGGTATAAIAIQEYDGANVIPLAASAAAANAGVGFSAVNTSTVGVRLHNFDGAVAGVYISSAYVFTI